MEKTINEVFKNRAQKYQGRLAIEKKLNGGWEQASWNDYYDRARSTGLAFNKLGIEKGDRLSLLSENRLEWLYTDMGALGVGACVVPIYTTLTAEEVAYIVGNSGSRIIVVENKQQLDKALYALDKCESLEKIIVVDNTGVPKSHADVLTFDELLAMGREVHQQTPGLFADLADAVEPPDPATIVYTSGTTGVPKGVMVTHKNIIAVLKALDEIEPKFGFETDQTVPFLPLSHVFERAAGHYYGMFVGLTSSYAESLDTFAADVKEKRPTVMLAVPRVCEKVYQKIMMQVEAQPQWKQAVFRWGLKIGMRISELREQKKSIPLLLNLQYFIAFKMVFKKLAMALGGRVRWLTAAGAPTAREIILFFNAAGMTVVEGYGMTECFAPAVMSNLADYRIGTVGRPLPGVDVKIAEDGEILIKGENVFSGYWKMEKETEEAFTPDGYLKTGDIGAFDDAGMLMITDRKKDLIITSGGKNIAPQKIENLFKSDPLFSNFVVVGEAKKFLSALLTINLEQAPVIAKDKGIAFNDPEELLKNETFLKLIDEHIAERNTHLPRYETIKKYKLIPHEFSQEAGELTPSLKIKRKVIFEKYQDLVDSMYEGLEVNTSSISVQKEPMRAHG